MYTAFCGIISSSYGQTLLPHGTMTRSNSYIRESTYAATFLYTVSFSKSQYPHMSLNLAQGTLASIFEWIDGIFVAPLSHTTHYSPKNLKTQKTTKITKIPLFDKKSQKIEKIGKKYKNNKKIKNQNKSTLNQTRSSKELRNPDFSSQMEIRRSNVKSLSGPKNKKKIFLFVFIYIFISFWKINILKIALISLI